MKSDLVLAPRNAERATYRIITQAGSDPHSYKTPLIGICSITMKLVNTSPRNLVLASETFQKGSRRRERYHC